MSRGSYARVYTQSTPNARYVTEASFELNSFRRDKRPPFKFMRYFARSGQRSSAYRTENARIVHTGIAVISIPFFLLATIRSLARSRRSSTDASNFVSPDVPLARRYPKEKKEEKTMKSAERKNCNRLAIRKARANAATSFTYLEKQPWFRVIFDSTCRTVTVAAAKLSYVYVGRILSNETVTYADALTKRKVDASTSPARIFSIYHPIFLYVASFSYTVSTN